ASKAGEISALGAGARLSGVAAVALWPPRRLPPLRERERERRGSPASDSEIRSGSARAVDAAALGAAGAVVCAVSGVAEVFARGFHSRFRIERGKCSFQRYCLR